MLFQFADFLLDDSAVNLNLGLTHTSTSSYSTSLSLKMGPHTCQAGEHVVVSGQFDLHLGVCCLGPLCKNLQNQTCSVNDNAAFYYFFNVPLLCSRQFIVENDIFYLIGFTIVGYFLQFSASYVCCIVRSFKPLHKLLITFYTGSLREELKFIKILFYFRV